MSLNFVEKVFNIGGTGNEVPTLQFYRKGFNLGGKVEPTWRDVILLGNTALTLVNAKAGSLEYLKLFGGTELVAETYLDTVTLSGGCEQVPETYLDTVTLDGATRQSNVPEGYTEVDGITNGGNKQINTGNSLNQDDEIELVFSYPTSGITQQQIYGYRESATANNISIFFSGTANRLVVDFNNSDYSAYRLTADLSPNTIYTVLASKSRRAIYQGDTLIAENTTVCNDTITIDVTNTKLFGVGGNPAYNNAYFTGTIYSLKIKNKRNMIACKRNSDNAVGFYNNVSSENFYTLQGGTAGAVVVPTPTNPIDIVCNNGVIKVSRNIFDKTKTPTNNSGATRYWTINVPNGTYTCSTNTPRTNNATANVWFDDNANFSSNTNPVALNEPRTITVTGGVLYAAVRSGEHYTGLIDGTYWIQVEEGSTATTYRPYGQIYVDGTQEVVNDSVGNSASAERLLAVGGYKDTQEVLNGSVTRRIGIKVLDGTENWTQAQTANAFYLDDAFDSNVNIEVTCYCNYFYGLSGQTPITNMPVTGSIKCGFTNALRRLYIRYSGFNSLSDLTSYLASKYNAGTPVIIVYPISSATTSTVTGQFLSKSPVTQTAGSIDNLPIAITESSHTTPTPDNPLYLKCNNGVLSVDSQGNITVTGTTETVEDFLGNSATAQNLYAVGSYKDTQEVLSGAVTRNVGILVLDGTETYERNAASIFTIYVDDSIYATGRMAILSSHFVGTDKINADMPNNSIKLSTRSASTTHGYVYIKTDVTADSASDFKQWVADQYNAGTPVIIVYPISSATTSTVSKQLLTKSPVTQTAGSISNMTITTTESSHTTPTPQQPLQINCNNGELKIFYGEKFTTVGETTGYLIDIETEPYGVPRANANYNTTDYIFLKAGEYTAVFTEAGSGYRAFRMWSYELDGTPIERIFNKYAAQSGTPFTFTLTSDSYVRVSYRVSMTNISIAPTNPILYVEGTTETVEIDTTGDTATAERLFAVGDYKDVQSVINGNVTRNVGIKVLDGTEDWSLFNSDNNVYTINIPDAKGQSDWSTRGAWCSHFLYWISNTTPMAINTSPNTVWFNSSKDFRTKVSTSIATTTASFKQYLADQYSNGTPVIVVYPLATPTTETVTGQPMNIQAGTNVVEITQASMDNLELEVKYKAGVEVTITEIENAQLDDNVEVIING